MNLRKKIRREDFDEEKLSPSLYGEIRPLSKEWWKAYLDYCNILRKTILKWEKEREPVLDLKMKLSDILGDWYKYDRLT